jgi:uncharacterized protein
MKSNKKYPPVKLLSAVSISIAALFLSHFLSNLIMQILSTKISGFACAAGGFLYMWFTLTCLFLIGCKTDITIEQCHLIPVKFSAEWIVLALIVPAAAYAVLISSGQVPAGRNFYDVMYTVFFAGIGTAAAEEGVYRGIVKTAVERRWGTFAGNCIPALIPAAIFIILHKTGIRYSFIAVCFFMAQGLLLSLIVNKSGSIWNAVAVHAVCNIFFAGTVFRTSDQGTEVLLVLTAVFSLAACLISMYDSAVQHSASPK